MPKFSPISFTRLSTCHPDLQALFYEVIKTFDCMILEGYRNENDQDKAFMDGKSQLPWPNSKHNKSPSMAVDVTPYPLNFFNTTRLYWFAGYVMAIAQKLKDEGKITHSVRCGADWDNDMDITDQTFNDVSHFELVE
jgi:peptidoglycan L-alanyl-D-glutamate endopeptidase CwlK